MDIDLVYLWVDGNDPVWAAKRDRYIGRPVDGLGINCEGRYVDNNELMFSLRSIEKYASWIHRIFIVTDNQTPSWLRTDNPKIRIVDHREIMPAEILPTFNSIIIEHYMHNIPELSEHFIYANDDMFLANHVTPSTFFAADGQPIIRLSRRAFKKLSYWIRTKIRGKQLTNYKQNIHNAALLVERKYGVFYNSRDHHNIVAYRKSFYRHAREVFKNEIDATVKNRRRSANDIQRVLYSYVPLAEGCAHRIYINSKESFYIDIHDHRLYEKFKKFRPKFLCMNDSEHANNDDRRLAREFLQQLFPEKSEFEKS